MKAELDHVVNQYALGEIVGTRNLDGYTNRNVHLQTAAGEYVLRSSHPGKTEEGVIFEASVLRQLKQKPVGSFIVDLVETAGGSSYVMREGQIYTLFRFVEGEQDFYTRWNRHSPDVRFTEDLGSKSAMLHGSLSTVDLPNRAKKSLAAELTEYLEDLESLGLNMEPYLPLIGLSEGDDLVHTDLRVRNFVVKASEIKTILDFDDLTYGNQLYDVAWTIKECLSLLQDGQGPTPMINTEAAKLFLKAYQADTGYKLSAEDLVRLMALTCVRTLHFLYFSAPGLVSSQRIEQLASINLAQLDLFSKRDEVAEAIMPE